MNHAQLRAFHAVATEGSFTKAARALSVSQPAVTIQVKALEETYGVELLHRRGHHVSLTELGWALLEVTRRIFSLEQEAEELVAAARELRHGHLRVGADGPYFVMELLAAFMGRYDGVRISVTMGNSQKVLQDLLEYRTDVAVLAHSGDDRRFHVVPYCCQPIVAFARNDHPWAARKSIRLAELDGEPMVMREEGSATRRIFETALKAAGVQPEVMMEIGSREALREAVAAGLGIGIVSAAEMGRDDRVVACDFADVTLESWESVVCLKERRNVRTVQAFYDLAEAVRPALPTKARRRKAS